MKQKKQSYTKIKKKKSQKYKGLFLISKNQNKRQSFNSKSNHQTFLKLNYDKCVKSYSSWNAFLCWLTAFGYSNNQREATVLQNVK
jgi:hypothetical protein